MEWGGDQGIRGGQVSKRPFEEHIIWGCLERVSISALFGVRTVSGVGTYLGVWYDW